MADSSSGRSETNRWNPPIPALAIIEHTASSVSEWEALCRRCGWTAERLRSTTACVAAFDGHPCTGEWASSQTGDVVRFSVRAVHCRQCNAGNLWWWHDPMGLGPAWTLRNKDGTTLHECAAAHR